jgi:membrane protease YdiL (CAAX protease family)
MNEIITPEKSKKDSYKLVCAKLGFVMCVFFLCRIAAGFTINLIAGLDNINKTVFHVSQGIIMVLFIYAVPMLVAAILFKSFAYYNGRLGELFKKPERLAKKLGTFPAMYGLGYGTALLTILANFIISRFTEETTHLEEVFQPTAMEPSGNLVYLIIMVLMLVIAAPVFEEFLCRGIMYDALAPYGNGIAIVVSSLLFGLMHGSFYMLFYTTAIGFALGYVRYATGSLYVVTILHALLNSVAAGLLVMSSLVEMTNWENMFINTLQNIYILAALILIFVGIVAFLKRIPVIRKYKIESVWIEISSGKKLALFFVSAPVIIMLVLAFDEHANNMLLEKIIGLF